MEILILQPKNRKEARLIRQLAEEMGIQIKSLSKEKMEDMGMAILMSEVDRTKYVSREEVIKALDTG